MRITPKVADELRLKTAGQGTRPRPRLRIRWRRNDIARGVLERVVHSQRAADHYLVDSVSLTLTVADLSHRSTSAQILPRCCSVIACSSCAGAIVSRARRGERGTQGREERHHEIEGTWNRRTAERDRRIGSDHRRRELRSVSEGQRRSPGRSRRRFGTPSACSATCRTTRWAERSTRRCSPTSTAAMSRSPCLTAT